MTDQKTTGKTDSQLLAETKEGTLTSFETLVKRYEDRLLAFAYRHTNDEDAARDIVQETFIRVYNHINSFDLSKPFSPWVYKITKNLSLDVIRKGRHTAILDWEVEDTHESVITRIIKSEQITALWSAIKTLPEMYKAPLVGFYFANLSIGELANTMNMSENTIKTRLRRAKGYLRTELGRKGYG
jgi:RNA polymerase sigma-70 factor, ECF subfamily